MVEEILQWLKNISIFLIFMTTVLNLIPEKEDKKPVQVFSWNCDGTEFFSSPC